MTNSKIHVVFYFPWREISGGPVYLTNLAASLSKNQRFRVSFVDYPDGASANLLKSIETVELITVSEDNYSLNLDSEVTLVLPIYWAHWMPKLPSGSKVLFVNWHKLSIPVLKQSSSGSSAEIKRFLKLNYDKKSTIFCDLSHFLGQYPNEPREFAHIVPISIGIKSKKARPQIVSDSSITIGILGRLSPDKITSVINLLSNLETYETKKEKVLHIIGDGPSRSMIDSRLYPDVRIVFAGEIPYSELDEYLISNVDAVFAMGTSCLEAAALALPTIIVPHSMESIDGDEYVFIQNSTGACLGWYPEELIRLNVFPVKLEEVLTTIYAPEGKQTLGQSALNYLLKQHDLASSTESLVSAINQTDLDVADVESLFPSFNLESGVKRMERIQIAPFIRYKQRSTGHWEFFLFGKTWLKLPISASENDEDFKKTIRLFRIPIFEVWYEKGKNHLKLPTSPSVRILQTQSLIKKELRKVETELRNVKKKLRNQNQKFQDLGLGQRALERSILEKKIFQDSYIPMSIPRDILSEESLRSFRGEISDQYIQLIKDLDTQSIGEVVRILDRLRKDDYTDGKHWITFQEENELRKIYDHHASQILKLGDDLWAYGAHLLPSNVISTTTFYSRYFTNEIRNLAKVRDGAIIDAGGFFGDSLLIFSPMTDLNVHVFEPHPELFEMCKRTVTLNKITNATLNPMGLGERSGEMLFLKDGDSSRFIDDTSQSLYSEDDLVSLGVTTVDDYVKSNGLVVSLIKADIEGLEMQMLRGATETIREQKPVLLLSMYHNFNQFFELKKYVESLNLGYEFKIRKPHDTSVIIDTVLIAEATDG